MFQKVKKLMKLSQIQNYFLVFASNESLRSFEKFVPKAKIEWLFKSDTLKTLILFPTPFTKRDRNY